MTTSGRPVARRAQVSDVDGVARLHRSVFAHYESSRLGYGFCVRLIAAYMGRPDVVVLVAGDPGVPPAGYLVGCPPSVQRSVNDSVAAAAAWMLVLRAARSPSKAVGEAAPTWRRVRRALATRAGRLRSGCAPSGDTALSQEPEVAGEADERVVLVGVTVDARGCGTGDALLGAFRDWAATQGATTADLSVETDNVAARRCYERNGWQRQNEPASGLTAPDERDGGTQRYVLAVSDERGRR